MIPLLQYSYKSDRSYDTVSIFDFLEVKRGSLVTCYSGTKVRLTEKILVGH